VNRTVNENGCCCGYAYFGSFVDDWEISDVIETYSLASPASFHASSSLPSNIAKWSYVVPDFCLTISEIAT
jgi:hypothetical protein